MRFTKFLAATMAAMTIVSCSEQVEDFGANVQPGDAVLSFKVGTNGGTTYATSEDESKVNTLIGFLAYTDQNGIAAFKKIDGTKDGLTTTIPEGEYTAGSATMYFVANMPAVAGVTDEAALTAFTDTKTIYTNVGGALTLDATGMSATRKVAISLKPGQVTEGTPEGEAAVIPGKIALKRLAARVYAVSGNVGASDITDYKVDFAGTKANSTLFGHVGGGTGTAPQYTIKGDGTGQYGSLEAVGYVYPSADDVTITVTHKDGTLTKDIKFKPEANKNYKLIITPTTASGTTPSFSVAIAAYDDGGNLNVDFTNSTLPISSTATLPANFKVGTGGVLEITDAVGTSTAGVKITLAELFKGTPEASLEVYRAVSVSTLALGADYKISADGMFAIGDTDSDGLNFFALANDGADKTYKATFELWDGTNESSIKSYVINVVLKSVSNLPANFTTTIDGVEFMSVNWQGTMEATKTLVTNINKMSGVDFAEKTLAFSKVNAANLALLGGKKYLGIDYFNSLTGTPICPAGFTLPSKEQVTRLFQFTKFDGTQSAIPLKAGINSFGDNTIDYQVSHSFVGDKAGNRLFIQNKSNFATSVTNDTNKTVLRVIFWDANLQFVMARDKVDTSVRCVKATN